MDTLQTLRDHRCHQITCPAKLLITIDGERKTFHDKIKFKHHPSTNPALQKALEEKFQPEEDDHTQENTRNKEKYTPSQHNKNQ